MAPLRICLLALVLGLAGCDEVCWKGPASDAVELGRGVNLGDMLEAPTEGYWGATAEQEYFELARQAGFDFVRLPVNWRGHARLLQADPADVAYEIDPEFFERVDQVVCWSLQAGLPVIIDFHHYDELMTHPNLEQFAYLWRQIAEHYRDYPPQVLFELANEPTGNMTAGIWNEYVAAILPVVRESNPRREVIVGSVDQNSFDQVEKLELPVDEHIIVTFHYYLPPEFTHQGASWVENSDAWLGTAWEGTAAQRAEIEQNFNVVADWARRHGQVRILVGEFGAYSMAPQDSRVRWTRFVREQAEARGFAWAYWELVSKFGIYDRETDAWREDLVRALFDPPSSAQ